MDKEHDDVIETIDLSGYSYDDLHKFFEEKFGSKNNPSEKVMNNEQIEEKKVNDIRLQMNAEIFEGIGNKMMRDTSSMLANRAIYVLLFMIFIALIIYMVAFNPSLVKRIASIFGYNSYVGPKATV